MKKDRGIAVDSSQIVTSAAHEVRQLEEVRDECKSVPASKIASWRDWLEQAAIAGDSAAREDFAHSVLEKFRDPLYKEENYDEYKRENSRAFRYLQDSVANGDCDNEVLNGFRWVGLGPTECVPI